MATNTLSIYLILPVWSFAETTLIHFAGAETATEWRSYTEGALQSAERASAEVAVAISSEHT